MFSNIIFFLAYSGSYTSFFIHHYFAVLLFGFFFLFTFANARSTDILSVYISCCNFLCLPQIRGFHASIIATVMSHSEFNQLCDLFTEFLSERYPSLPEHLPFSSGFFDDSSLPSQVSFRDFDELHNAHPESYPITPPPESFGLESSSQDFEMNSLSYVLDNYGFNDSNSDVSEFSCEYFGGGSNFYCDSCNHPVFECVCCWHCHYSPLDCICNPKSLKAFNCDKYNTGYCSSSDDGFSNGFGTDNKYDYNSDCKYYCSNLTYGCFIFLMTLTLISFSGIIFFSEDFFFFFSRISCCFKSFFCSFKSSNS
ncbi:hypothetical protein F8M41_013011 [Gigaspora margarita]|uniref:Uncharacterized protein n=1 Tax=Gigaspora margarita TaxID=4874 RepID=A0A8H4EPG9_GIGMA|nr:hypothetical protein F8M41_013011 [Gigaspora margarita]